MRANGVRSLLIGGQACVFYGAAEFSRDTDLALLASPANLDRFNAALSALQAQRIAVPPLTQDYLRRGHAVHFRCHHPDAAGMRIDVLSVMRGVAPFEELWERRTTVEAVGGDPYDLLSLPDLAQAKKTQRDKDWPMLRRLIEAHYFQNREHASADHVSFWLTQLRTPALLVELAPANAALAGALIGRRPLIADAMRGDQRLLEEGLRVEEAAEREADRRYWEPLRAELALLRRQRV
jgi:hypothetical protein